MGKKLQSKLGRDSPIWCEILLIFMVIVVAASINETKSSITKSLNLLHMVEKVTKTRSTINY